MKFLLTLMALLLFVNEVAFGKTVQVDQLNLNMEIPDGFLQQDSNTDNSVYFAVRSGPGGSTDTFSITSVDGTCDFTDSNYVNGVSRDYVSSGFRVLSCELKDMGDYKALVSDLRNHQMSKITYQICSNNHIITIAFSKTPAVETRLINDSMVNDAMSSLAFISIPDTNSTASTGGGTARGVGFGVGSVVGVVLLALRLYRVGKAISS